MGTGPFGVTKTLHCLQSQFYWLSSCQDVELFLHQCDTCTTQKGPTRRSHAPLQQYQMGAPMERVAVNILGPSGLRPMQFLIRVPAPLLNTCEQDILLLWCARGDTQ